MVTTLKCLLCNAILGDCRAALSHECALDKAVLEKAQLHKIERERDKKERAQFAIHTYWRYLFYPTKLVVPYEGRSARDSTALDCRTICEFICSLDIYKAQQLSKQLTRYSEVVQAVKRKRK